MVMYVVDVFRQYLENNITVICLLPQVQQIIVAVWQTQWQVVVILWLGLEILTKINVVI